MSNTSSTLTPQQRKLREGLNSTIGTFAPSQSPYPEAKIPEAPTRRRNPRALIVAASRIQADVNQVRKVDKDPASQRIQELAAAIKRDGLLQPPGVQELPDGHYQIIYGEGRFIAMTEVLGWIEIEVIRVDAKEEDVLWLQLQENIHRTDLSPLDLASAVKQAQEQGYSLAKIAERMCKSESWVQKAMTISERLSEGAMNAFKNAPEKPAMDTVYAVAQVPKEAQAELAEEVVNEKLTRRETQARADTARKQTIPIGEAPRRTGRKKKSKPYEETWRAENGASVTVKFRKTEIEAGEVIAALEEVLAMQKERQGRAA